MKLNFYKSVTKQSGPFHLLVRKSPDTAESAVRKKVAVSVNDKGFLLYDFAIKMSPKRIAYRLENF